MTSLSPVETSARAAKTASASTSVQIVDPISYAGWDALLSTHAGASFFHSAAWAKTLASAYGFQCRYVVATRGNELRGLLPFIEARSWLRGSRGVSLAFTDECPPLLSRDVSAESLLDVAMREGVTRDWKYLELRGGHALFKSLPQSAFYYGHVLPLGSSAEDVFEKFESSVQRAIRKAERSGITIEFGTDLKTVEEYYRLHCQTRTRRGAPPQPFSFFRSLCDNALQKGQGFVALARNGQHPIAGAVFLHFAGRAIYKFAAFDEHHQQFRGSNLVIWHAIRKLIDDGVAELNFGKTSLSNDGLRRFKLGWGAEEYFIRYARYCFARQTFVKIADLAAGAQARVFAALPVFLSRWVGRAVYAHLS